MKRIIARSTLLVCVFLAAGLSPPAQGEPAARALQLLQRRVGLGTESFEGKKVALLQRLTVDAAGRRIVLEELGRQEKLGVNEAGPSLPEVTRTVVVRMDREPAEIVEWFTAAKKFRRHSGDLNRMQKERDFAEANLLRLTRNVTRKERETMLRTNYLRADGKREVKAALTPGELILGRRCDHLVVTENGRTIIDAQMANDLPGASSYFELYKRLGVFSEDVLKAIGDVRGVPLKAKITVVTHLPAEEVEVEVLEVNEVDIDKVAFEPPAGFTELVAAKAKQDCPHCGKSVNTKRPGSKMRKASGEWLYFCSPKHHTAYLDKKK